MAVTKLIADLCISVGTYPGQDGSLKTRNLKIGKLMESTDDRGNTRMFALIPAYMLSPGIPTEHRIAMAEWHRSRSPDGKTPPLASGDLIVSVMAPKGEPAKKPAGAQPQQEDDEGSLDADGIPF